MGTCLNHYVSRINEKSDNDGTKKSIFLTVGKLKKTWHKDQRTSS